MPWAAAAAVVAAGVSAYASNKASNAQRDAAKNANDVQLQMYNQTRQDLQPYSQLGINAISQINALNSGDYSGFLNSPDYLAARQMGIQGMDASAASRGNLYSGGYSKDLATFNNQLASQNYGNYYNRLAGLLSVGENAAAGQGNASQNYANAYGQNANAAGSAQASGYINTANSINNGINQLAKAYGSSYGNSSQTSDPYGLGGGF